MDQLVGLSEIDDLRRKVEAYLEPVSAHILLSATADAEHKFRRYMVVRTKMSLTPGLR